MKLYWLIALVLVSTAVRSQDSTTECLPSAMGGIDCTTKAVDHGPYHDPSLTPLPQGNNEYLGLTSQQAQEVRDQYAAYERKQIEDKDREVLTTTPQIVQQARIDAENGVANAQMSLGVWYWKGINVPKNEALAAEWFKKAAAQGNCGSQFGLGVAYASGHGLKKDWILAYAWFNIAATIQNSSSNEAIRRQASDRREALGSVLSPADLREAQRLSANWRPGRLINRKLVKQ